MKWFKWLTSHLSLSSDDQFSDHRLTVHSLWAGGTPKRCESEKKRKKEAKNTDAKRKKVMNMCSRHSLKFRAAITVARKK